MDHEPDRPLLLSVERLGLTLPTVTGRRRILDQVCFTIGRGEALGLVGESGSGKSMTARSVIRLLPPGAGLSGSVRLGGASILELGERELRRVRATRIAMVFQDPHAHINPVRSVGDFLTEATRAVQGLSRREATARALQLLEAVHVDAGPARLRQFPHELSGGLLQRVMIAAALAGDPELLIADEPTTALDVTTQSDVMATLLELRAEREMALLFITHDLELAGATCNRTAVFYAGSVVEERPSAVLQRHPAHPYTIGLIRARPELDGRRELFQLRGLPPESIDAPGCAFAPRCEYAVDRCRQQRPAEVALSDGRARCDRLEHVAAGRGGRPASEPPAPPPGAASSDEPRVALEARNLRKVYRSRHHGDERVAVSDVSFTLTRGGAIGIVGESGSGKTTVAKMLVGLEPPSGGQVLIDGVPVHGRPGHAERRKRARRVQLVFQNPYLSLDPRQRIGAALAEALSVHFRLERDERRARVQQLLESVGLDPSLAARRPRGLSGGQRQRVAIARALACEPAALVLDEAVSALDISVQAQVLNLLNALRRDTETALVFISHDLAAVAQVTEYIYVMHRGAVVEQGTTHDVLANPQSAETRLLLESVPREGWSPRHVRAELAAGSTRSPKPA